MMIESSATKDNQAASRVALETGFSDDDRSLLAFPLTWHILAWWTVGYGVASWVVEWYASGFDMHVGRMPFWSGVNRMVYALV